MSDAQEKELTRLTNMIEYALEAPNEFATKSILFDALHGCNFAQNCEEVWAQYGTYQDYLDKKKRTDDE